MARRKSKIGGIFRGQREVITPLSLDQLFATPRVLPPLIPISMPGELALLGDQRVYHPAGRVRPYAALTNSARVLKPHRGRKLRPTLGRKLTPWVSPFVGFSIPSRVAICVRRKVRRSVLHAYGKVGGGGRKKTRRRNSSSEIRC